MKFNPRHEMEYRTQMARKYLEDAEERLRSSDFKGCVQYSQLAAENAAKAVIATRRTPSWGHDPSSQLLEVAKELGPEQQRDAARLAEISSRLAPEHGRTTYGEPERFVTPWALYDLQAAQRTIAFAREAIAIMKRMIPTSAKVLLGMNLIEKMKLIVDGKKKEFKLEALG